MKTTRLVAVALATVSLLGCAKQTSNGPVQWTASNQASPEGQTAAQAWSRSTTTDAPEHVREAPPTPSVETPSVETVPTCTPVQPGVTNLQPPAPRWPYSGVTLQLGTTPP
jgi:hypothetical protein